MLRGKKNIYPNIDETIAVSTTFMRQIWLKISKCTNK